MAAGYRSRTGTGETVSLLSRTAALVGPSASFGVAAAPEVSPDTTVLPVRPWKLRFTVLLVVADTAAAVAAAAVCFLVKDGRTSDGVWVLGWRPEYRLVALVSLPVWLAAMAAAGAYRPRLVGTGRREYELPVTTAARLLAVVAVGSFALDAGLSRSVVVIYFPCLAVCALAFRFGAVRVLEAGRRQGRALRRLLVVGDARSVAGLVDHLNRHRAHGYVVVGCALPRSTARHVSIRGGIVPVVGRPDRVLEAALAQRADAVAVIGHGRFEQATVQQVAWQLERSGVELLVAPDVVDLAGPRIRVAPVTGLPLLHIDEPRIHSRGQTLKAVYERILAVPLLAAAAPVMAVLAVLIRLDSKGPILYTQERVGKGAKPFEMLKFRTMVPDAEEHLDELLDLNDSDGGVLFKIRDDPRVTRVGRWMRKYSLDELPQLLNVVRGDMLLIGPRPCLEREVADFGPAAHRRFMARPGLTGLWQVSGRSDLPYEDAVRLDLYYVENWSVLMDLQILYKTVLVILSGSGGY